MALDHNVCMKTTEIISIAAYVASQGPTAPWREWAGCLLACGRMWRVALGTGSGGIEVDGVGDEEW